MGVRFPTVASNAFVGPYPANATETVVCTTPGISEPIDNAQVLLFWFISATIGASITSFFVKIRRGTTITGTSIGAATAWPFVTTAATIQSASGWYFDSPGVVAGLQYSLTVVQTAATGASTNNDVALIAMVL